LLTLIVTIDIALRDNSEGGLNAPVTHGHIDEIKTKHSENLSGEEISVQSRTVLTSTNQNCSLRYLYHTVNNLHIHDPQYLVVGCFVISTRNSNDKSSKKQIMKTSARLDKRRQIRAYKCGT
jgi:hypothetical protein